MEENIFSSVFEVVFTFMVYFMEVINIFDLLY